MHDDSDQQRSVSEAYASAVTSTNMRVEADRRGDADVIIAAAWSMSRVGSVLLRLHSEFDRSERPRPVQPEQFLALVPLKVGQARVSEKDRASRARALAHGANVAAISQLLSGLHSMPAACVQVADRCARWGMHDADAAARTMVRWWLHSRCPACGGTMYQVAPGAQRHTGKACKACHGVGTVPVPLGQDGRRVANWMDSAVEAARHQIRNRLRAFHPSA